MAYRNTFFRWLFLYSLTFGLTYVLKLFTYLCPETGQFLPVYYVHCRQKSLAHTFSGRRMLRLPFVMFQYQLQSNPLG